MSGSKVAVSSKVWPRRRVEIEDQLDLTKNQAPNQLEAVADNENEEKYLQEQTQAKPNRRTQRTAVRV